VLWKLSEFEKLIAGSTTYDFTSLSNGQTILVAPSNVSASRGLDSYEKSFSALKELLAFTNSSFIENSHHRLWKWLANSPPIYRTVLGTVLEQFSGKQSSPFYGNGCASTSSIYRNGAI
jgi:hypothetical protein